MENITKQCVGIDCAKKDFMFSFGVCDSQHQVQHLSCRSFKNDPSGFKAFNKWVGKYCKHSVSLTMVMEATGVYHENLAYFLHDLGYSIAVVLPKRAKDFSKTLKVKKVTDKIASQYLATMGLEKKLDLWHKPSKTYVDLKHLTREKERIQRNITQIKNQLEAEKSGVFPNKKTLQRLKQTLGLLNKQKAEVVNEIKQVTNADPQLKETIKKICTIPGGRVDDRSNGNWRN